MTAPNDAAKRAVTRSKPRTEPARPRLRVPFAVIVLATLTVSALAMALPASMPWSGIKLLAATYAVLLVPGAVILRSLEWPRSPAAALAGSAAWSMVGVAPGLVLVVMLDGSIDVALIWLLLVIVVGLVVGRGKPIEIGTRVGGLILLLIATMAAFAVLLWFARWNNVGDAVEHIARIRKLTELNPLRSLQEVNLLPPDSGFHPGYAFPLWHAVVALIARVSGLEEPWVFRSLPPLLVPLVAAAVYGAGRRMFGCRAAGVAAWIAYLALFAFPAGGVGYFNQLSYPGYVCIFLVWPLLIDRAFAYLRVGGREPVWTVAAATFLVAAIHPSYSPFIMVLIGAFVAARFFVVHETNELRRLAVLFAAASVPFLLFVIWLYPIATSAATAGGPDHFATLLDRYSNGTLRLKPEFVTRGGVAYIAALVVVPVAAAASRTRAAAFIAGGTAAGVLILTVPLLFTPFSEVMSVSQSRRFVFFLPWAFALVGGTLVLARFRYLAVVAALGVGLLLHNLYPGSFTYRLTDAGPGWVAWFGAVGALVVLVGGASGKLRLRYGNTWAVPIVIALAVPVAFGGLAEVKVGRSDATAFPPHILGAVRQHVGRDDVLIAPLKGAYHLTAHAPIYITAAGSGHGGDTVLNNHEERRMDVRRFFSNDVTLEEAAGIIRRWDVDWILVTKEQPHPRELIDRLTPVFEGRKYTLYPVDASELPPE